MLEEVKTNTFELFISNSKQVGSYQIKQETNIRTNDTNSAPKENLRSAENVFNGVMNNLKSRPDQASKKTNNSSEYDQKQFSPKELQQAVNKISKELTNEIQNPVSETECKELSSHNSLSTELNKKSDDQEVNYLVLSEMKQHVDYEIEKISKSIAELDLNSVDGINQIIELSDQLEALRKLDSLLDSKLQSIDLPIEKQITLDEIELDTSELNTPLKRLDLVIKNNNDKTTIREDITSKVENLMQVQLDRLKNDSTSPETPLVSDSEEIKNIETNLQSIKDLSRSVVLESTKEAQVKEIKIEPEAVNNELSKNLVDQERLITLETNVIQNPNKNQKALNYSSLKVDNTSQEVITNLQETKTNTTNQSVSQTDSKLNTSQEIVLQTATEPALKENLQIKLEANPNEKLYSNSELTDQTSTLATESRPIEEMSLEPSADIKTNTSSLKPSLEPVLEKESAQSSVQIAKDTQEKPLEQVKTPAPNLSLKPSAQLISSLEQGSIENNANKSIDPKLVISPEPKPQTANSQPQISVSEIKNQASSTTNVEASMVTIDSNEITNVKNNLKAIKDFTEQTENTSSVSASTASQATKNTAQEKISVLNPNIVTNTKEQTKTNQVTLEVNIEEGFSEKEGISIIPVSEEGMQGDMSDMEADSFNQQAQPETQEFVQINNNEIKNGIGFKVNNKIQTSRSPVSLNELSNVLAREVVKVNPGETQELTMSLTPGDMGQIDLTISKSSGNKLEIKMVFSQENAFNTVEHKLTELRTILKSRGFEAQIELSRSESTSTDSFNRPGQDSFNEAKEEQKERILNTMPEWLRPDENESFKSTLQQII